MLICSMAGGFVAVFLMVVCSAAQVEASYGDEFLRTTGRNVTVTTDCNSIVGKRRNGNFHDDGLIGEVDWFLGIRYASAKRFEKPILLTCDEKTIDATMFSDVCLQLPAGESQRTSEDCLNLNIYSPVYDSNLPVMVFIHGGSYYKGSGASYVGDNLAQHGVVVVTINYRLNIFGFLSAPHLNLSGNYGLHDQIAALKWVQRFIRYFRGDPTKVTIFGNSAGGGSVGLHILMKQSKGLFSQAIMQSGSPFAQWAFDEFKDSDRELFVRTVARVLGCSQENFDGIVACLKKASITQKGLANVRVAIGISPFFCDMTPVVDGSLMEQTPEESDFIFDGPFMAGIVSKEFELHQHTWFRFYYTLHDYVYGDSNRIYLKDAAKVAMSEFMLTNFFLNYTKEDAEKIHNFYEIKQNTPNDNYVEMMSDIFLGVPTLNYALKYQHLTKRKTYFYEFNHSAVFTNPGNLHEIELNFIFGYNIENETSHFAEKLEEGEDRVVSKYMMTLWTNFAKTGNPNSRPENMWEPLGDSLKCFVINNNTSSRLVKNYKSKQLKFWNGMKKIKGKFPVSQTSNAVFLRIRFVLYCFCLLFVSIQ